MTVTKRKAESLAKRIEKFAVKEAHERGIYIVPRRATYQTLNDDEGLVAVTIYIQHGKEKKVRK